MDPIWADLGQKLTDKYRGRKTPAWWRREMMGPYTVRGRNTALFIAKGGVSGIVAEAAILNSLDINADAKLLLHCYFNRLSPKGVNVRTGLPKKEYPVPQDPETAKALECFEAAIPAFLDMIRAEAQEYVDKWPTSNESGHQLAEYAKEKRILFDETGIPFCMKLPERAKPNMQLMVSFP
jgi:hypothetical protein